MMYDMQFSEDTAESSERKWQYELDKLSSLITMWYEKDFGLWNNMEYLFLYPTNIWLNKHDLHVSKIYRRKCNGINLWF